MSFSQQTFITAMWPLRPPYICWINPSISVWLCVGSCSHWTTLQSWSTDAERLWRPQDEQIRQPGVNVQVGSVSWAVLFSSARWKVPSKKSLFCSGRQHLRWTTPPTSSRFSVGDCSGSGLFCTTLWISNATVNETGQYQCSYKDLKVEDGKTAAAAYVFVQGKTLSVLIYHGVIWSCDGRPLGWSSKQNLIKLWSELLLLAHCCDVLFPQC